MDYKRIEEEHYDSKYLKDAEYSYPDENQMSNNDKVNIASRNFIELKTREIIKKYSKSDLLDFGCAIGEKTYKFAPIIRITGIDISTRSVEIANKLALKYNVNGQYLVMDCESLKFENKKFDIVYDFGTFSSIDMKKALPEICRVLKNDGYLISIETLGNNPLLSFKRMLNVLSGTRTEWAAGHIMKIGDWKNFSKYFGESEIKYFSFLTILLSPFLFFIPQEKHNPVISFFNRIDEKLLKYRFFQYFAFKTVAILSKPRRHTMVSYLNEEVSY